MSIEPDDIDLSLITDGSWSRLKRIMELKKCGKIEALEFAIAVGWTAAERLQRVKGSLKGKRPNGTVDNK